MEANYYFQNRDLIDNPVNMKHVIIDFLRGYGIFAHVRDLPSNLYNVEDFLYEKLEFGITYQEDIIRRAEKDIEEEEKHIQYLDDFPDDAYNLYYNEGKEAFLKLLEEKEPLMKAQSKLSKLRSRMDLLGSTKDKINTEDFPSTLAISVKAFLSDCQGAIYEDIKEAEDIINGQQTFLEKTSPEDFHPVSKDEYIRLEKTRSKDRIEFLSRRISEAKETIKRFKEKDKAIKKLFEFLDTIDSKVE